MSVKRKLEEDEDFITPAKKINSCLRRTYCSPGSSKTNLFTGNCNEEEFDGELQQSTNIRCDLRLGEINQDDYEELKSKLDIVTKQLDVHRNKFKKAEEDNKNKLKHLETTSNCKIEEKDKLIVNLQLFIDEQEAQHKRVLDERGGEDAEITFNYTNPLHRFASQIKSLQSEKYQLTDKNSQLEIDVNEMRNKYSKLEATISKEYITLSEYNILEEEVKLLRQSPFHWKREQDEKENLEPHRNEYTKQSESTKKLNNVVRGLRNEIKTKEKEHFDDLTKLRDENHSIRKKLSASLNNYTNLAFTPPKTVVKEVMDAKTEQQIDELKSERIELQWELKSVKREMQKVSEKSESIITQNKEYKDKEICLQEELEATKKLVEEIRNDFKESKMHYATQIVELENKLLLSQEQSELRENAAKVQFHAEINKLNSHSQSRMNLDGNFSGQLKKLSSSLKEFRSFKADVATQITEMKTLYCDSLCSFKQSLQNILEESEKESSSLLHNYCKEIKLRKKLHNKLVELKGNIRVLCRVRPFIMEDGEGSSNVISFNNMDDSLIFVEHKASNKKFEVDKVFPPNALQTDVFAEVKSLIESCLDGYNVCIFAYGQTGSGKTYTMEGTLDNPGINQQALHLLFDKSVQQSDWDHTIHVSFIEIYNETLIDLLSEECNKLVIKQGKDGVHVPGLTCIEVNELSDVNQVFSLGHRNRTVASTSMNERSSRSHSVLTITVTRRNVRTGTHTTAKLNLVDLAGSERISKSGSEGVRMKEAQSINKSLSALGDVIYALKNKTQHVPYRNSKLTYLLQESLSGDSKTLMMVQVSPADKNSSETFCSLDFAQRVRSVELGKATCSATRN